MLCHGPWIIRRLPLKVSKSGEPLLARSPRNLRSWMHDASPFSARLPPPEVIPEHAQGDPAERNAAILSWAMGERCLRGPRLSRAGVPECLTRGAFRIGAVSSPLGRRQWSRSHVNSARSVMHDTCARRAVRGSFLQCLLPRLPSHCDGSADCCSLSRHIGRPWIAATASSTAEVAQRIQPRRHRRVVVFAPFAGIEVRNSL
jgi:hypothetical protein